MNILDEVSDIMKESVEQCLLPHFQKLAAGEVSTKSSATDFVTVADMESEKFLTSRLKKLVPDSLVVGEEVAFNNAEVLDGLCCHDTTVWIIDPLDGTKNFIKGKDVFGVIVSMIRNGEVLAGWIYVPLKDKLLIKGEKGAGVWKGRKKLTISQPPKDLHDMQGTLSIELPTLCEKIKNKLWWGSAAFSYAMLLTGEVDFGIYRTHPLQPWDHAAGVFMYQEAGGYSALADGSSYRPVPTNGCLISAPNKAVWEDLAKEVCTLTV